jgi:alanine dehydrogenase
MKIGLLREGKIPMDHRVPLIPSHASELQSKYPNVRVIAQSSDIRCFTDDEYLGAGIEVRNSIEDCDVLLGVKEVPVEKLIAGKTYFFFSHTIKKQAYNKKLLQEILKKEIMLIDYEVLTDSERNRIVAFGRYAGIVGAYNGILAFGLRYKLFKLRRAHECFDLDDLKTEYTKVKLPNIKILITGGGRVAKGAIEVLLGMGIRKVNPSDFINERFKEPVFSQINPREYNKHKEGKEFKKKEFHQYPERFGSDFLKYRKACDLLIAAAYWDPSAPKLFTREDMLKVDFNIRVIADITCDIDGSIPSTKKATTIDEPFYDYNPEENRIELPFVDEANVSVMSIDNLPAELPRNASEDFGRDIIDKVLPSLIEEDKDKIIERATITSAGNLTPPYQYLQDFVAEQA